MSVHKCTGHTNILDAYICVDCAIVYINVLNRANYSTYYKANVCRFAMILHDVCVSVCLSQID